MKKLYSYPKINLSLKIYKKEKQEHLHKIDSIFVLYKKIKDVVYIKKSNKLSVIYKGNSNIKNCLITKSLLYLKQKYYININYKIIVKKNIPIASGFGGGSSNAATIINYFLNINNLQNIHLNLNEIVNQLGSDVPFFLTNYQAARVQKYGQFVSKIIPLFLKVKIFYQKQPIITEQIFNLLDNDKFYQSRVNNNHIIDKIYKNDDLNNISLNDLEPYILQNTPILKNIILNIRNKYRKPIFFTGSGSSIVCLKRIRCGK